MKKPFLSLVLVLLVFSAIVIAIEPTLAEIESKACLNYNSTELTLVEIESKMCLINREHSTLAEIESKASLINRKYNCEFCLLVCGGRV